ncbi:MAG TPA: ATP-binding protein [Phycisphaerae bacterium]|nr:ATP-binding protein [Phycisphaerae bacterium]HRY71344.1 ATP-binding protein [Phycisphaerae bacterium]HSA29798.1 ATP-binding protein [Phycisphaerae bacterium]
MASQPISWLVHKPPWMISALVSFLLLLTWGFLRLVVFSSFLFPLTYVLPLLVGIWTRNKRVLWAMAAACLSFASMEFLWLPPEGVPTPAAVAMVFGATLLNTVLGAAVVHVVIVLRDRLELSLSELTITSDALQAEVAERKKAQEELARYRDHLEELVALRTAALERSRTELRRSEHLASLGTLAGGIAHEVNNPIGGILLAAEYALLGEHDHDRMSRALTEIVEYAKRTKAIVSDVLLLARQGRSEMKLSDLKVAVHDAIGQNQAYAERSGCRLVFEAEDGIPLLMLNTMEMEQAVTNMIRNAVEAGARQICVSVVRDGKYVLLNIEDNGKGIPDDCLDKVFEPFYSTRLTSGGTGLGLSIVHRIIRSHGGTIDVSRAPGQGTRFAVQLPIPNGRTDTNPQS